MRDPARHRRGQRRHQALRKVADLVVGLAGRVQQGFQPETEQYPRVGVSAADDQNDGVDEDQCINQRRERKAPVRGDQDRQRDQNRRHFHPPGKAVVGMQPGDGQKQQQDEGGQDEDVLAGHGDSGRLPRMFNSLHGAKSRVNRM